MGTDLNWFMEMLFEVDAALLVMTPGYKRKVVNRTKSGVFTEYGYIMQRYADTEQKSRESGLLEHFEVVPVLFSGTRETAVPDEITSLKYLNMVDYRAIRYRGKPECPNS